MVPKRTIVCAAVKMPDGLVICGPRHFDHLMRKVTTKIRYPVSAYRSDQATHGFVDQYGYFLTREEAWPIALANGQIVQRTPADKGYRLHSENLY